MDFTFPSLPDRKFTVEEMCERLATNYRIIVTPEQFKNAFRANPQHDFFRELHKWPDILETPETSREIGGRIRETAQKIGFTVEEP